MLINGLKDLWAFIKIRWLTWGFTVLLSIVAVVLTHWVLTTQTSHKALNTALKPTEHIVDYRIDGLNLFRTRLDGTLQTHIQADSAIHYRDNLMSEISNPKINIQDNINHIHSEIIADKAIIKNDGETIELNDNVILQRYYNNKNNKGNKDNRFIQVSTDKLMVLSDDQRVYTDALIKISDYQHNIITSNQGIDYHHSDAVLNLKGRVYATLMPVIPKP